MQYAIPECNMESLEKKLTRIKNKCRKYGCEFKYERVGEHFEDKEIEYEEDGKTKKAKVAVKFIDIEVEGKAEVNGWQFAASLEYTSKGNIINSIGNVEIPSRYYTCAPWCEHCKTNRDRKYSYIVYNGEEFKQVGKACLKDFTGGLSAESVAQFESWFKEVEDASENYGGFWGGPMYFDTEEFMAIAAETIRIYGYFSRSAKGFSTADRAEYIYRVKHGMRLGAFSEFAQDYYYDALDKGFDIEKSRALVKTVRNWVVNNERDDNYFHNLKVACSLDHTGATGLLVSAFPTYDRELAYLDEKRAREEKEREAASKSSWMGNVGDRVSFQIADFRVISSWDTQWGTTAVFKLTDADGREATWKTSSWLTDDCIGATIKGTVKEQKEYRGIKQTELTRCKLDYSTKKVEKKVEKKGKDAWDEFCESYDMLVAGDF